MACVMQYLLTMCDLIDPLDDDPPVKIKIFFTPLARGANMETMTSDLLLNLYAEEMGSKYKCLDVIAGFACNWCIELRHDCYMGI